MIVPEPTPSALWLIGTSLGVHLIPDGGLRLVGRPGPAAA
jgi:hypothetical protein